MEIAALLRIQQESDAHFRRHGQETR